MSKTGTAKNPPDVPARVKPTHAEVIDLMAGSEAFRTAQHERDAKLLARRRQLAGELTALDGPRGAEFREGQSRLDKAIAEQAAAQRAVITAANKLGAVRAECARTSAAHAARHDELEQELRASCHPAIAPFIVDMKSLWDGIRKYRPPAPTVTTTLSGEKIVKGIDVQSVTLARITAIRDAIAAAEDLALEPDQAQVPARLEELRRGIPTLPGEVEAS
jgi:hypothetical protein